jgi:DNA-binding IclR family transcriptional regulator
VALGQAAAGSLSIAQSARPALEALRDDTGESVQLYVRDGDRRVCALSLESPHGLRTIVPLGASLPLDRGSAGRVLLDDPASRRRGWAESVEEREPGVASVSAPVFDAAGSVLAAVSVSGPIPRTSRSPGRRYGARVAAAARAVEAVIDSGR